ncbi:MAG: exodeoxyribonuclease VII small subunit [Anaerolineales bacterium]|nr:exodeoxyribonuclease VII small subunit [Anaerolineales bacterium]
MSASPQPAPSDEHPVEELTFEQAFAEFEAIVARLESGEHNLEVSLALYERGQALARRCAQLLDQAELKVKQLSGEDLLPYTPAE